MHMLLLCSWIEQILEWKKLGLMNLQPTKTKVDKPTSELLLLFTHIRDSIKPLRTGGIFEILVRVL